MKHSILVVFLLAFAGCSKTDGAAPANNQTPTPNADKPADPAKKGLLDKAKEAVSNIKEGASTPLTSKSVTDLLGVANDLKAEFATAAGQAQGMDLKSMIAKAKDLKTVAEQHGFKTSELTGLVTRVGTVMSAINSGNIPENLKPDVAVLEQYKAQLQALFGK